jgi:hypothetical protein
MIISIIKVIKCFVFKLFFPDISLRAIDVHALFVTDGLYDSEILNQQQNYTVHAVREMAWWRKVVEVMLPCYGKWLVIVYLPSSV